MKPDERSRRARRALLAAIYHAGSGHPGGSLSCVDVLVALWERSFRDAAPNAEGADRLILSKGHACPALYAVAAEYGLVERGELVRLRELGSPLQGHPHVVDLPWVGASTGSLGQGFSVAIGRALGLRHRGLGQRVYVVLGDGELQEGEVWEGALCAAHHRLDELCAIVDYNKLQSDDWNANVLGLEPLAAKWEAFGWHVQEVDGHDHAALDAALARAEAAAGAPNVLIAHTTKGKGVPYMEDVPAWHGSVKLRREELAMALTALDAPASEQEEWLRELD